jgi:hypothetical protein
MTAVDDLQRSGANDRDSALQAIGFISSSLTSIPPRFAKPLYDSSPPNFPFLPC